MAIRGKRAEDHPPTIYDVARLAGVSHTTVSRVLNNVRGDILISEATQEKVMRAVAELNYRPSSAARALAMDRTRTLAVALYDIDYLAERYFVDILGGVLHAAGLHDYNVQLNTTTRKEERGKRNLFFLKKAEERQIDGVIVVDQHVSEEDLVLLQHKSVPFVLVDRCLQASVSYVVKADNFGGAYKAAKHLISLGRKNIVFFCEPPRQYKMQEMISGFREAMRESPEVQARIVESPPDERDRVAVLMDVFSRADRPTGLMMSSDKGLPAVKAAAAHVGCRIPEDVEVVGYGDWGEAAQAEVTAVTVPLRDMGEKAGEMLIALVEGREPETQVLTLPVELAVRKTRDTETAR